MSEAHNIGDVALLEPGCYVRYDFGGPEFDHDAQVQGIMIGREQRVDAETGEVRSYVEVVQDWRRQIKFHSIPLDRIDKDFSPPNSSVIRSTARAIARDIGGRKNTIDTKEMRLAQVMMQLYELLGVGR